jgi:hypothetical protein
MARVPAKSMQSLKMEDCWSNELKWEMPIGMG